MSSSGAKDCVWTMSGGSPGRAPPSRTGATPSAGSDDDGGDAMNNGQVTKDISGGEIPEGMNDDARETWPSEELIKSWLGNELDFEMRLGEHTPIPDDPESAARARRFRDVLGLFA